MKFVRYQIGAQKGYAVLEGESVQEISGSIFGDYKVISAKHKLSEVRLLPPCEPTKLLCVGLNFRDHIEELKEKIQPSELRRGCICVPKTQQSRFGIGNTITMRDADDGSTILVPVQSQHRLNMRHWYNRHSKVKPGDEIIFEQQTDGFMNVKVIAI